MEGANKVEVKPFGPDQLYVEPGIGLTLNCKVLPTQMGEFPVAIREEGVTETGLVVNVLGGHPTLEIIIVYTPTLTLFTFPITGCAKLEVNPFGPVQA
jgi:hypothetical protein